MSFRQQQWEHRHQLEILKKKLANVKPTFSNGATKPARPTRPKNPQQGQFKGVQRGNAGGRGGRGRTLLLARHRTAARDVDNLAKRRRKRTEEDAKQQRERHEEPPVSDKSSSRKKKRKGLQKTPRSRRESPRTAAGHSSKKLRSRVQKRALQERGQERKQERKRPAPRSGEGEPSRRRKGMPGGAAKKSRKSRRRRVAGNRVLAGGRAKKPAAPAAKREVEREEVEEISAPVDGGDEGQRVSGPAPVGGDDRGPRGEKGRAGTHLPAAPKANPTAETSAGVKVEGDGANVIAGVEEETEVDTEVNAGAQAAGSEQEAATGGPEKMIAEAETEGEQVNAKVETEGQEEVNAEPTVADAVAEEAEEPQIEARDSTLPENDDPKESKARAGKEAILKTGGDEKTEVEKGKGQEEEEEAKRKNSEELGSFLDAVAVEPE